MGKFDGDQYQLLLNQFEHIRQSGSVEEYMEDFGKLAHGILLYNNNYDDTYFVTRFVTGLKDEIRRVIVLHRPKTVDSACALALLQEEELAKSRAKTFSKEFGKATFKGLTDKAKIMDTDSVKQKVLKHDSEDKLSNLKHSGREMAYVSNVVRSGVTIISVQLRCHCMS
jgi:hypothetical protein